jgi:hypothetical protein
MAGCGRGCFAIGLLGLPYTEVGSRWLLSMAAGSLPESLTYESFDGALAGSFELRGVEYSFGQPKGRLRSPGALATVEALDQTA